MSSPLSDRLAYVEGMLKELVDLGLDEDGRGYRTITIDEVGSDEDGRVQTIYGTLDTWSIAAGSDDSFVRGQASPLIIGEWEGDDITLTNVDRGLDITERIVGIIRMQQELKRTFALRELEGGHKAAYSHPLYILAEAELSQLRESLTLLV